MINVTNFNTSNFNATGTFKMDGLGFINNWCMQLNSYFIRTGIIIIIAYIVMSWGTWWFFNHGYKHFKYNKDDIISRFVGHLERIETRQYWDRIIKDSFAKIMLCFIVVLVYFHW